MLSGFFFFENYATFMTMCKRTVEPGRPQMTKWRMRIACYLLKSTNTIKIYNNYCFSTSTMVARKLFNITLYVHGPSCVILLWHFCNRWIFYGIPLSKFLSSNTLKPRNGLQCLLDSRNVDTEYPLIYLK